MRALTDAPRQLVTSTSHKCANTLRIWAAVLLAIPPSAPHPKHHAVPISPFLRDRRATRCHSPTNLQDGILGPNINLPGVVTSFQVYLSNGKNIVSVQSHQVVIAARAAKFRSMFFLYRSNLGSSNFSVY